MSGALFANRAEFQRMMRDAAAGAFEAVVFYDLDRFGRNARHTMDALNTLADLGEPYPRLSEGPFVERMEPMARPSRYSPEVRERAVRMVREHGAEHPSQWAAIASIAAKLGCTTETLRRWVRQAERDAGQRAGLTTDERQRLKELERENRELKRANEILKKASAYFAQAELDRRAK